ncbi:MAG: tRNA 2-selenouridine(34) synthase MnmH, partial [Flammeovirgaceae bacterium]|nr:tRNA 2-selenouridine(34) synthase MnmH [Flammeovirgaceae bacterium]
MNNCELAHVESGSKVEIDIKEFFDKRKSLPLIDVRSEGEFEQGHIPGSINIPILTNAEREKVGTDYKLKGSDEAVLTGFRMVGPRLDALLEESKKKIGDKALVYCWRGGMRSDYYSRFISMVGISSQRLSGGYKMYRQLAMEYFAKPYQLLMISGCTGSGKSEILRALKSVGEQVIDLEDLANHKGSVFGGLMKGPQPSSEQFQNNLFENLYKLDVSKRIWVEDESIAIGKIFLPEGFWKTMRSMPVVEIKLDKQKRIQRLVDEYGQADKKEFLDKMEMITKKLGGQHFKAAKEKLQADDMHSTIDILLTYYDKAYINALKNKAHRN